jgi:hypothetical protein
MKHGGLTKVATKYTVAFIILSAYYGWIIRLDFHDLLYSVQFSRKFGAGSTLINSVLDGHFWIVLVHFVTWLLSIFLALALLAKKGRAVDMIQRLIFFQLLLMICYAIKNPHTELVYLDIIFLAIVSLLPKVVMGRGDIIILLKMLTVSFILNWVYGLSSSNAARQMVSPQMVAISFLSGFIFRKQKCTHA